MRSFAAATLRLVVVAGGLLLAGCAGYGHYIQEPRLMLERGDFTGAIGKLKPLVDKRDNDQLLYLMDLGVAYHMAGQYTDAITTFQRADKLAGLNDYTSVTKEAGAVLLNDDIKEYKGEDFEKVLIPVYLAMDYTLLGKWEDALVECRRVNHALDMMIAKGQKSYQNNAFAKYLAAALFEAQGDIDDAIVDYRTLLKWGYDQYPYLAPTLLKLTDRRRDMQELEELRKKFSAVKSYRIARNEGEIVVLVEVGRAPYKVPSPQFRLAPVFQKNNYVGDHAVVHVDNTASGVPSATLFDIEMTAIRELNSKLAGIIAKKAAGIVAKEAAAYGMEKATNNKTVGALTSIFLHLSDHADVRSWTTLPARLQIARMPVSAGKHDVALDMVTSFGAEVKGVRHWSAVDVKPGTIVFLHHRARD